jgi:hypothetical protein
MIKMLDMFKANGSIGLIGICSMHKFLAVFKLFVQILALAFFPTLASGSSASLSVLQNGAGQKVVFDSVNNEIWYWDLSAFADQTYSQQLADIQQLNISAYFKTTGWHLATPADMQPLWSLDTATIRADFNPTEVLYEGSYEWHYWSGRFESGSDGFHSGSATAWGNFYFGPFDFTWPDTYSLFDAEGDSDYGGAWVVSTVPEPQTTVLLGCGSAILLLLRRRLMPPRRELRLLISTAQKLQPSWGEIICRIHRKTL